MALIYTQGFDYWDGTHHPGEVVINGPSFLTGRYGGRCCLNGNSDLRAVLPGTYSTVIAGIAVFIPNLNAFELLNFQDGLAHGIEVWTTATGQWQIRRNSTILATGTQVNAWSPNVWYYIELKVTAHSSAGSYALRVNGQTVPGILDASGVNTISGSNNSYNTIGFTDSQVSVDDCYVCDDSGTTNNDFLGDVRIDTLYPTGAGTTTQWTPSTGSNWQNVDDAQPTDDTDYNSDATVGDKDTYAMGNLTTAAGSVKGVVIRARVRKDDAGSRSIVTVARSGASEADSSSFSVPSSYAFTSPDVRETKPGGGAWSISDVNGMEIGVKVSA